MIRFHICCIAIIAALLPAPLRADDEETRKAAEAWRKEAEAHVMPHAEIPIKLFLTDEVLKRVPADSAYFRDFLKQRTSESLDVSVIFPPSMTTDGHAQPMVDPIGTTEITREDGSSVYINVAKKWATVHRLKLAATVQFVLTVAYNMPDGTAALILPCSVEVAMTDKQVYSFSNPAVDLKKMLVVTRPKN